VFVGTHQLELNSVTHHGPMYYLLRNTINVNLCIYERTKRRRVFRGYV